MTNDIFGVLLSENSTLTTTLNGLRGAVQVFFAAGFDLPEANFLQDVDGISWPIWEWASGFDTGDVIYRSFSDEIPFPIQSLDWFGEGSGASWVGFLDHILPTLDGSVDLIVIYVDGAQKCYHYSNGSLIET